MAFHSALAKASHNTLASLINDVIVRLNTDVFVETIRDYTPEQLRELSACAVSQANQAVRKAAAASEERRNMGTTLVSAVSYDCGAVITNVGDSRAYHITKEGITRVTKDHSLVESMVDRGDITAEEARRHPNRNLITRALARMSPPTAMGTYVPWRRGLPAAVHRRTGGHGDGPGDALRGHPRRGPRLCLDRLLAIVQEPRRVGQRYRRADAHAETVRGADYGPVHWKKCWTTAMRSWSGSAPGHGGGLQGQVPPSEPAGGGEDPQERSGAG